MTFGFDYRFEALGLDTIISPGGVARRITGGTSRADEYGPTFAISLSRGGRGLSGNYRLLRQDGRDTGSTNTITQNGAIAYTYTAGPLTIGLDGDVESRNQDPGAFTDSYRVGLSVTYRFEKPRKMCDEAPAGAVPLARPVAERIDMAALAPGASLAEVQARRARAGIVASVDQPGLVVYEARILPGIDQRQRLALVHAGGRLVKAALVIEFDNVGNLDSTRQTFARVQEALIGRYGAPRAFEQGAFTANLVSDVNTDRFIRLSEWRLPAGILRLGIPHRLDEQVGMEVQYAASLPPPRQTRWSIEAVR